MSAVEWDFGNGRHSYQGSPTYVFEEPGRSYSGFVIVVDRAGQAITKTFTVDTSFPPATLASYAAATAALGLVRAASLALQRPCAPAHTGGACLPLLLVSPNLTVGIADDASAPGFREW